ncbi:hypothetical protein TNCT_520121, partial [Trichonephila clavata]
FPSTEGEEYKVEQKTDSGQAIKLTAIFQRSCNRQRHIALSCCILAGDSPCSGLPLPNKLQFMVVVERGRKISKSLGNVIDPIGLAQEFGMIITLFSPSRSKLRPRWQL